MTQFIERYQPDPWLKSKRTIGAVLALLAAVLGLLGYSVSPEDVDTAYVVIMGILSGAGGLMALISKIMEGRK